MSLERRIGGHPGVFSKEIRSVAGRGTIPDEWGCRVIDLDQLYLMVDEELFRVKTSGHLWAWYRLPVEVVAVAEQKDCTDPQQSWDVTRALALQAGIHGFRVVRTKDDKRRVTDATGRTETFDTTRDFVDQWIRPLITPVEWPF